MKRIIISLLAVAGTVWATTAWATPPSLTSGKGKGIVIIQLERKSDAPSLDMMWNLRAAWFDAAAGKPYVENAPTRSDTGFGVYAAPSGRYYMVARANAGRSVFTQFEAMVQWKMCLDGGSYAFSVPEDRYTYLGRLDPRPAQRRINGAVQSGLLLAYPNRNTLMTGRLDGFVPAGDAAELAQVQKDISGMYEKAVEVTAGDAAPETFETALVPEKDGVMVKACWAWSSKDTRPQGFNGFRE